MRSSLLAFTLLSLMVGCVHESTGTKEDPSTSPPGSPLPPACVVIGSAPATLFSGQGMPATSFAYDGGRLYFESGASILSADLQASCVVPEAFTEASDPVSSLAIAKGALFVATDGAILQRSRTRLAVYGLFDKRPTAVGFGNFDSAGMATDGRITFLLVRQLVGFELRKFGAGDDDGSIVDSSNAAPGSVLTDADAVYWTAGDTLYRQSTRAVEGTQRFARLPGSLPVNAKSTSGQLVQNDRFIFWQDGNSLVRVEKATGVTTTLTGSLEPSTSMALDASSIYLAEGGRLTRVPIDGGEPKTLAMEPGIATVGTFGRFLVWSLAAPPDPNTGATSGGPRLRAMLTPR